MFVYTATNLVNGKVYVGKTVRPLHHAKARHAFRARQGMNSRFYAAIRKYGFEAFRWDIAYTGTDDADIQKEERRLISELNTTDPVNGYNMTPGGDGGAGRKLGASQMEFLRKRFSGEGNACYGKFGSDHPAYGHKLTDEHREKLRAAARRPKTPEHRKALSLAKKKWYADKRAMVCDSPAHEAEDRE